MLNRRIFLIGVFLAHEGDRCRCRHISGHVIIASCWAVATCVLAILWFVVGALSKPSQEARRRLLRYGGREPLWHETEINRERDNIRTCGLGPTQG